MYIRLVYKNSNCDTDSYLLVNICCEIFDVIYLASVSYRVVALSLELFLDFLCFFFFNWCRHCGS